MAQNITLAPRVFPSRVAHLGLTVDLPNDWISHELPIEELDFSSPTQLAPLAIVAAPHAAIIFAFAARPAYDDGTAHDWASYLLRENNLQPRALCDHQIGNTPGIVGESVQDSDVGPLIVRYAFFEDGGRLINITLTAPELLADDASDVMARALRSEDEAWQSAGHAMARDARPVDPRLTGVILGILERLPLDPLPDVPGRIVSCGRFEALLVLLADLRGATHDVFARLALLQRRLARHDAALVDSIGRVVRHLEGQAS